MGAGGVSLLSANANGLWEWGVIDYTLSVIENKIQYIVEDIYIFTMMKKRMKDKCHHVPISFIDMPEKTPVLCVQDQSPSREDVWQLWYC